MNSFLLHLLFDCLQHPWFCLRSVARWVWLGVPALVVGAVQAQQGDVILLQRGGSPQAQP